MKDKIFESSVEFSLMLIEHLEEFGSELGDKYRKHLKQIVKLYEEVK
jgi:hypothetical protein